MVLRTCVWFRLFYEPDLRPRLAALPENRPRRNHGAPVCCLSPIVAALRGAERFAHELLRRHLGIGVLDDARQLVPVEPAIEADAEPAAVADVGRHEEPLRLGLDEHLLHPVAGGAPDCEATVPVVVVEHHHERPLAAHEERGRAVTRTLTRLRQRQADAAQPLQHLRVRHAPEATGAASYRRKAGSSAAATATPAMQRTPPETIEATPATAATTPASTLPSSGPVE